MNINFKFFLFLLVWTTFTMLSGCYQQGVRAEQELIPDPSINQDNPRATLVLGSEDLVGDIRISSPRFQSVGQLTRAQVTVQNLTDNRYTLEYKFDWADSEGFAIGSLSSWHRYTLSPRQIRKFTSTGKVPEATTITFTTRLPDDVFIQYNRKENDSENNIFTD